MNIAAQAQDKARTGRQNVGDFLQARQPRGGVNFQYQRLAVPIQNQPWPAVALAVDQAITGGLGIEQTFAPFQRVSRAIPPPVAVDGARFSRVQNADANGRIRVEQSNGQEAVLAVENHGQFAGFAVPILFADAAREQPRRPAPQYRLEAAQR